MMHKYKIPAVGVVLDRSGCVSTVLNWEKLFEVMQLHEQAGEVAVESPGINKD
jgi:hypothetical protein